MPDRTLASSTQSSYKFLLFSRGNEVISSLIVTLRLELWRTSECGGRRCEVQIVIVPCDFLDVLTISLHDVLQVTMLRK